MTYEEFQAEIGKKPEETADLMNTLYEKHEGDFTKHLTEGKKMFVATPEEYATATQKAIDTATKQNHSAWEARIEKVTGLTKPPGVKGLEWFDQVSEKLKYLTDEGADPNSAIIKGLQKELKDVQDKLSKKDTEALQNRIDGEISSAIKGLKFAIPSTLKKDDEKSEFRKQKIEDAADLFGSRYKTSIDDNGKIVYTNKKNEAQTLNGEPMTADQIAARDFANQLEPVTRKQGGAGSGEDDDDENQHGSADFLGSTTEKIREKIAEMGIVAGTDKWMELYTKAHLAAGYVKTDAGYVKK